MIPIPKTPGPCQTPWPTKAPALLVMAVLAIATAVTKALAKET